MDSGQQRFRRWAPVAVLIGMVVLGGMLLQYLQRHPILPQPPAAESLLLPAPSPPRAAALPAPKPLDEEAPSAIDPAVQAAPETEAGTEPVPTKPDRDRTQDLLSRGLDQLHRGQTRQARDTLHRAASMDPDSEAIREALSQADHALNLARLDHLRQQASAARRQGEWSTALDHYQAALTIDHNVSFALRGRQYVTRRITLAKRMDYYLNQPEALFGSRHLTNAVQLLAEAEALDPKDQPFIALLNRLETAVNAAQTPIKVSIFSDGQTEVAVYQVGRLGRFDHRRLELKPGTYTVVGTREGYRDVRLRLAVKPGSEVPTLRVVCEETIQ